jgi:DNA-binding NtrC family response regulator
MVCKSLELLFRRKGFVVQSVHDPRAAFDQLAQATVDLALLDMNFSIDTSGKQGLNTLRKIRDAHPALPVILMTGWATVQLAVEGMKIGASDFIAKPWDNQALLNSVTTILQLSSSDATLAPTQPFGKLITQAAVMQKTLETARKVAATDASVLITGESGTGKELMAEAIHLAGKRAGGALVAVNLGGVPESLFESELFGHKAGAFTDAKNDRRGRFELAEGGTLFLDEIGDITPANQVKLLRVLQERRYARLGESQERKTDIRLISATSQKITKLVAEGTFREDLLYRINLIHLHLPPLRERRGDIPLLANHFLKSAAASYERPELSFAPSALEWLAQQPFPGNIRQLRNLVERAAILSERDQIEVKMLTQQTGPSSAPEPIDRSGKTLVEVEQDMIRRALLRHNHNISATAEELGLTRAALYRRLEKYGIRHDY